MARHGFTSLVDEPSEAEVMAVAREIGRLCDMAPRERQGAGDGTSSRSSELIMRLAMRVPEFQTQLFRFVDVFPSMTDDSDTVRHLTEYLGQAGLLAGLAPALRAASALPMGKKALAGIARREIARIAGQFIVGDNPATTAARLGTMWRAGTTATIDLLGEHTVSNAEADRYAERLADLCAAVSNESPSWPENPLLERDSLGVLGRVAVSIKPSALAPDFAPLTAEAGIEGAKARLRPILKAAAENGTQVYFDMERYETKEMTHRLFRELLAEPELEALQAGIVVQAYLRDSFDDLRDLIELASDRSTRLAVRLVKGAYWDTETVVADAAGWPVPVFSNKAETDLNFERCSRALLAARAKVRPAFGSHNLRSLAYVLSAARSAAIPAGDFEIQLLYGMAEPVHEAVRRLGLRLRVYAPMGELVPGMAYLVRRLLENTSQEGFVRLRFAEGRDVETLARRPSPPPRSRAERRDVRRKRGPRRKRGSPPDYRPAPLTRWYSPPARAAMKDAVLRRSGGEMFVPARIGGRAVQTARVIRSLNPADPDEVVATTACAGSRELGEALASCDEAVGRWSRLSAAERAGVLFGAASYISRRRYEVAALEVLEAGKGWADADGDVCEAIDYLEYYGREALRLASGGPVQSPPGETNRLDYRGRGVVAVISPWNFPLAIPTGMVSAALVTGNTVILKPAEQTTAVASVLAEALTEAGLPEGVLAFLPGYGEEIGDALVTDRRVVSVAFTGSRAVGLHINEAASRTTPRQHEVRRVVAEMGGKNAIIVDSDADLDVAVPTAVQSAFGFAGQRCSAASRVVVLRSVHDAFVERFVEATRALRLGPPAAMGSEMGPLIDAEALERVQAWQEQAGRFGEVVLQRDDLPAKGYFAGPTVVDGVVPASSLWHDEIFGPVVAICSAGDFDEAIALANESEYALTAGLVSRSPAHIARAAEVLRAGNVYVNRPIVGAVVGRQPFGGHGMSGFGQKAGGPDYLMQFLTPRVVTENTMRQGFAPLRGH